MPDYDLGTARGRIDLDASSLGRAQAALQTTGLALVGMGAVAVGAFAYAVKSAADFEKIISAVGAVTGATGKDLDLLRDKALDMATTSAFSASEIARAFEDLGKAGITVPQILDGAAEAVVRLAEAAGTELPGGVAQGAEIIANALKTFEVGADQAMHFADVLVGAAASSTLSVDDMATTFKYAGPIAHELGLSIDDLATTIAILGDRGIKGSTAGTSLRGVLLSLTPTSNKAKAAMRELGLITEDGTNKFYDQQGALKSMPEVMQLLGDATKDLTQQQKIQAFNTIFQRRAMNSALILANAGAAGFNKYADAIAKLDASTIAAKKLDNLSGDMTILRNTVNSLIIRVGIPLQDMLRGWVQGITSVVTGLSKLNPEMLAQVLAGVALAGAVIAVVGSMLLLAGAMVKMYRIWVEVRAAIGLVTTAMKLLTISFLTNPVFLFVAALAALGAAFYLLYKDSQSFRDFVDNLVSTVSDTLVPVFDRVVEGVKALVAAFQGGDVSSGGFIGFMEQVGVVSRKVFDFISNNLQPILAILGAVLLAAVSPLAALAAAFAFAYAKSETFRNIVDSVVNFVLNTLVPALQDFATEVVDQFGKAMDWLSANVLPIFREVGDLIVAVIERVVSIIQFFGPLWSAIWKGVGIELNIIWNIIKTVFQAIGIIFGNFADNALAIIKFVWTTIKNVIQTALQIIKGIIQVVTGIISGDWGKVWEGIKNIFSGVWQLINQILLTALGAIQLAIGLAIDTIISIWEIGWNTIKNAIGLVWDTIKAVISLGAQFIWDTISNFLGLIVNIWQSMWSTVSSVLSNIWGTLKNIVSAGISTIVTFFTELPGKILGAMSDFGTRIWRFMHEVVERARAGLEGGFSAVIAWFKGLPKMIIEAMGDLGSMLFNAGKKIIGGLVDGIKSAAGSVGGAIKSVAGGVTKHFPNSPQAKEGPLKTHKPASWGGAIIRGLMEGINKEAPALQKLMNQVTPTLNGSATLSVATGAGGGATSVFNNGSSDVNITFDLSQSSFGDSAESVREVFTDGDIINRITRAVKAGTGRRA